MELMFSSYATSVTAEDGKFHPAISKNGLTSPIYYWEKVKYATEDEAHEHASLALKEAYDAANAVSRAWNVVTL